MMNWLRILIAGLVLQCQVVPALANFAMSPSGSTTAFAIDAANQGTALCAAASTECPASVPVNTAGAPLFVVGNAGVVTGTGGTFPATQATASNLNATVVGTGTFATQLTGATNNINNIAGTVSLPTGAATSALQTIGNTALTTINTTLGSPFQAGGAVKLNLDVSSVGQPWSGLTAGGVNYGLVGVVDSAGSQLVGYTTGVFGTPSTQVLSAQGGVGMTPFLTTPTSQYPIGATPYTATAIGTTAATTATLTGASSVTTYLCGFSIRANATAAATGNATVTGTVTGTLNYTQWTAPLASGLGVVEQVYTPCVPASATNTSVAVVSAAPGTGGVVSVTAWGYKL